MKNYQRNTDRISVSKSITFLHRKAQEKGKMINLSMYGSGFISNKALEIGETIDIKFSLPTSNINSELELQGKVIHSDKVKQQYLIGLKFTEVSSPYKMAIQEFMSKTRVALY